jgi:pentafunctional AROM polypeptide
MGRLAATHLGYQFCDMDQILEKHTGLTIPQYLEKHSWEEFRTIEVHLLSESLLNHPESTVIACGGGIIETEGGRLVLKSWKGQVIHISRSIESIEDYFNVDKTRPSYGEDVRSTWNRRRPFYQKCSTLEYVYISPPVSWDVAEANFTKFLDFSFQRVKLVVPPLQNSSYFLSLTYPNIASVIEIIGNISQGANAIELRVDLLQSFQLEFVGHQIALLRSVSDLPIVFTGSTYLI